MWSSLEVGRFRLEVCTGNLKRGSSRRWQRIAGIIADCRRGSIMTTVLQISCPSSLEQVHQIIQVLPFTDPWWSGVTCPNIANYFQCCRIFASCLKRLEACWSTRVSENIKPLNNQAVGVLDPKSTLHPPRKAIDFHKLYFQDRCLKLQLQRNTATANSRFSVQPYLTCRLSASRGT
jgi:hypothetical protein